MGLSVFCCRRIAHFCFPGAVQRKAVVCAENPIRFDAVMESPKLAE